MISEIYPLRIRSSAMSAASMTNWAANFLVSVSFLTLVSVIGRAGTFGLYAVIGVVAVWFFLAKVPETMGRSLEQIEEDLGATPAQPADRSPGRPDRPGRASGGPSVVGA
jgi:Na+/melibiose symporter-like transporter